jgi:hypothetical protein
LTFRLAKKASRDVDVSAFAMQASGSGKGGRSVGAWFALVALSMPLAFFYGEAGGDTGPNTAAATPLSSSAPAAVKGSKALDDGCLQQFLHPIEALALAFPTALEDPSPDFPERTRRVLERLRGTLGEELRIETVVATVPDPVDSGFGYLFDVSVQALRLGFEQDLAQDGHFFRSYGWLPWNRRTDPKQSPSDSPCRKTTPGIKLFRGSDVARPRVRALLLVGETPTAGIHGAALVRALEIAEIFDDSNSRPSGELAVLGPTFSGSASSLRHALTAWSRESSSARRVRIVSGSATADLMKTLGGDEAWLGTRPVTFAATTPPESEVICRYLGFLHYRLGVGRSRDFWWSKGDRDAPQPLSEVALLHESGTEFGAALQPSGAKSCRLRAGVDITFPVHVARLRDAYEAMDRSEDARLAPDSPGRRTTLDVSLREKAPPGDVDEEPFEKTTYAEDIAVSRVLTAISRGSVRHVAIQASDVADAIFLARKLRDVAPDVRVAFFTNDVLLLHPAFRRDLLGSIVVSAYPFLGTSDFETERLPNQLRRHEPFENASGQGIYNAALVLRGVSNPMDLDDYALDDATVLPIWISAIGSGGLVPITAGPNNSAQVFGVKVIESTGNDAWKAKWKPLLRAHLRFAQDTTFPRFWRFAFSSLVLGFVLDSFLQYRRRCRISNARLPPRIESHHDRDADLAIVRTKWELYATIRTLVIALALAYMTAIYWLASAARGGGHSRAVVATILAACALGAAGYKARVFAKDYSSLRRAAGCSGPPNLFQRLMAGARSLRAIEEGSDPRAHSVTFGQRLDAVVDFLLVRVGMGRVGGSAQRAAQLSYYQLRTLVMLATGLTIAFVVVLALEMRAYTTLLQGDSSEPHPPVAVTLMASRSLRILNTVSPSGPLLLCLLIVYLWALGRTIRLQIAHGISLISPPDQVADLVSTPIRVVLYPHHTAEREADQSFTRVERSCLNSVLRPVTGPSYVLALLVVTFFPCLLFSLKPIATVERLLTTDLLTAGLALCAYLIGNTLVQLVQYWLSLELLLKNISQHRLGPAFRRVAAFARETVDEQVARPPHDLLRFAASALQFEDLVRAGGQLGDEGLAATQRREFARRAETLRELRIQAISSSTERDLAAASQREAALGSAVVSATSVVMQLLILAWNLELPVSNAPFKPSEPDPDCLPKDATRNAPDALTSVAWRYSAVELDWLRQGEAFAATVVALLVNRHVRQFQQFVQTLTLCALGLLLVVLVYPFEPHRLLLSVAMGAVLAVVLVGFWIYAELDRNTLISHIAGSEPGKLTFNAAFIGRVVAWAVVPLLLLAAAQYPDFANAIFRVADPALRALH